MVAETILIGGLLSSLSGKSSAEDTLKKLVSGLLERVKQSLDKFQSTNIEQNIGYL
jgi:hypothetical protein